MLPLVRIIEGQQAAKNAPVKFLVELLDSGLLLDMPKTPKKVFTWVSQNDLGISAPNSVVYFLANER